MARVVAGAVVEAVRGAEPRTVEGAAAGEGTGSGWPGALCETIEPSHLALAHILSGAHQRFLYQRFLCSPSELSVFLNT